MVASADTPMHRPKVYRGSRARIKRLDAWAQTPAGIWILFSVSLAAAFVLLTCLASLPPD
jgi:hypothetical protein